MQAHLSELMITLAEHLEASAAAVRKYAEAVIREEAGTLPTELPQEARTGSSAAERARVIHRHLGPRQVQALNLIEEAGSGGTDTGTLSRRMKYDQPNVYLTLQNLIKRDLVERDTSQHPHRYYLSPLLASD